MKTLAKIFMAVVAGVLAFSCVTDTTEDLGVNLGEGQSTTIGISLEDSRTHITGVPDAEGKYLMYWSEGDKIAVDGEASDALGEEYHGQAKATFKFTGTLLNYPYNIVYPAPAEGVKAQAEGCQVVTFPSVQAHNANSFAEGAVPMYGYVANESASTTLNHLAGVLRFLVQCGEGVESTTLKSMVVEVNHGSIAGNFDVDCATGDLTAHADAINTVTVSFGEEGLTVTSEPTPVYVSVPAGEYGTVSVTLYTENSRYTASFSSFNNENGDKSIKAGNVREFSTPIVYVPNAVSDTFLIYDEASLRNFASRVSEADFANTYPTATVVANIDLTGKEWTPIEGYTGTFDGLNHKITGLSAPLFGTTDAVAIQNLHLVDVDITSSGANVGPLACVINNTAAVISNCSTQGRMVIEGNTSITATVAGCLQYGGVVGYNYSEVRKVKDTDKAAFNNITADVDVILTGEFGVSPHVGGIVGVSQGSMENVTHIGSVTFDATINTSIYIYGLTYVARGGLINCVNGIAGSDGSAGAVTVTENAKCVNVLIAGIGEQGHTKLENCHNYGNLTVKSNHAVLVCAGIFRNPSGTVTLTNVTNHGKISISGKGTSYCTVGGLIGTNEKGALTITNCHNYGDIEFDSDFNNNDALNLGGLAGSLSKKEYATTLDRCNNYGDISFSGKITGEGKNLYVGGFTSTLAGDKSGKTVTMQGNCTNYGALNIGGSIEAGATRIGGCAASFTGTYVSGSGNIENKGNINCSITTTYTDGEYKSVGIGGWAGGANSWSGGVFITYNTGDITCTTAEKEGVSVCVGGIFGLLSEGSSYFLGQSRSFCNIEAKESENVGMILGVIRSEAASGNTRKCKLGGSIWKKGMDKALTIDATNYFNYMHAATPDWATLGVTNYDRCSYISSIDAVPVSAVAPFEIDSVDKLKEFRAQAATLKIPVKFTADIDLTGETEPWTPIEGYGGNTSTIEFIDGGGHTIKGLTAPLFGTTYASIYDLHLEDVNIGYYKNTTHKVDGSDNFAVMGALVCLLDDPNAIIENCSASGTITINETSTILSYVGGLIGCSLSTHTFSGLVNKVNINVSGTLSKSLYAAGCVAYTDGSLKDCQSLGNIEIETNSITGLLYYAGMSHNCKNVINCTNGSDKKDELNKYGNINVKSLYTQGYFSGIVTKAENGKITNCKNYGKIDISGTQSSKANIILAGITSLCNSATVKECYNYGDLEATTSTKTSNMFMGGIACSTGGLNLYDCYNYGNITYKAEATSEAMLYIGGITNITGPFTYHNLYNYGNVAVYGTTATGLYLGGIVGRLNSFAELSGDIINEGVIIMGKTAKVTTSGKCAYVGGLFGGCNTAVRNITGDNIYSRGPIIVEEGANAAGGIYIGGVIGSLAEATSHNPKIIGVKSACEIEAIGHVNIGMIIGTARDANNPKVKDCRVNGTICASKSGEGEAERYNLQILDATNYHKYIYGSGAGTDWTGAIQHDGNIFDSSLEAITMPEE